jgi:hypothetical protein
MYAVLIRLTVLSTIRRATVASLVVLCGCGGEVATTADSDATTRGRTSPEARAVAAQASSRINMDEIFPAGPGRDLVLNNCQNCHTFVPIVVLQMDKDAWQRNSLDHRDRVTSLTDEEFKVLYEYLTANFHPGRPVPKLPKELLETWTSY